jgi:hypothetical protein
MKNLDHIVTLRQNLEHAVERQARDWKEFTKSSEKQGDQLTAAMESHRKVLKELANTLLTLRDDSAAIATSQKILDSLLFSEMQHRHIQIHKTYPETFTWIFDSGKTPFMDWLTCRSGTFWIAGKAGSGKSTLMKFLADHERTDQALGEWAKGAGKRIVKAKFYFWHGGTTMQKSQEGLLQSLLYQTLRQCPELVPKASSSRWHADEEFHRNPDPWEYDELSQALKAIVAEGELSARFCFFIDGLDEYEGEDRSGLLKVLENFASSDSVKLCVSSRPWTVFVNSYGPYEDRKLMLQDLTKPDMDKYVKGMLEQNDLFKRLAGKEPQAWRIVSEVREKADGVFLWVFLVVRSLLRGMEEENDLKTLERRLRDLPSDLEKYFKHMIDTIDKLHQEHTAGAFQLAIHAAPLRLIAFWFLPILLRDPNFVLRDEPRSNGPDEDFDVESFDEEMVVKTTKTINAWCKDLLEVKKVSECSTKINQLDYKIDFLHRTVRDFLIESKDVQDTFMRRLKPDFDPWFTLLRLHLAEAKNLHISSGEDEAMEPFTSVVKEMMIYGLNIEKRGNSRDIGQLAAILAELDKVGNTYRSLPRPTSVDSRPSHWSNLCLRDLPSYLGPPSSTSSGRSNLLSLAVANDLVSLVKWYLGTDPNAMAAKAGWPLLNYALIPLASSSHDRQISYDMVLLLLGAGADPNADCKMDHKDGKPGATVWGLFLHRCLEEEDSDLWPVACRLVEFGACQEAKIEAKVTQATVQRHTYVKNMPRARSETVRHVVLATARECLERIGGVADVDALLDKARKGNESKLKMLWSKVVGIMF